MCCNPVKIIHPTIRSNNGIIQGIRDILSILEIDPKSLCIGLGIQLGPFFLLTDVLLIGTPRLPDHDTSHSQEN